MEEENINEKLNQILTNQILIMEYTKRETSYPHITKEMEDAIKKSKKLTDK